MRDCPLAGSLTEHLPLCPHKAVMSLDDVADTGGRLLQSAAGSRVGVAVSSLSFRIVFALRMVIFLYRGVPTILFIWLLPTFSRSTR